MKNQMVKTLIQLQEQGVKIYLKDEGYTEFLRLLEEEVATNQPETVENVG
jgi:hypothetical protein